MPFRVPDGGVKAEVLGFGSEILIPPRGFMGAFLSIFWNLGSTGAFRLLAQDLVERSWEDSALGSRADIGMAGIRMSPSNPGMDKIKLSMSYIQEIKR
jgi:hypothetical protein